MVSRGDVAPDPVEALLGPSCEQVGEEVHPLPPRSGGRGQGEGGGLLDIHLTAAPTLPPPAAGPALFTHGDLAVRRDAGGARVDGPAASLRVGADGSRIEGVVRAGADPGALAGTDLLVAFALALQPRGRHHLHAAATISPSGEAVLVAGTGGAGKSTLALALVASGHAYLGDDVVFVEVAGADEPRLLSLPRPFHLSLASARAHPPALALLDQARRTSAGKHLLDPAAAFPGAARAVAPRPAVLLLPEIAPRPVTALAPVPPADALGALLASALFAFTPLGTPAQRDALAAVAGAARAFRVVLGRDLLDDAVATARRIAREAGLEPRG